MAQYEELSIDKGTDVTLQLELEDLNGNPKDLTNYSAAAKMKRNYNSDSADTTDFSVAITPTEGIVTLSLTNQQTDALRVGNYVYDVEISFVDSNGSTVVERILEGKIRANPSVT